MRGHWILTLAIVSLAVAAFFLGRFTVAERGSHRAVDRRDSRPGPSAEAELSILRPDVGTSTRMKKDDEAAASRDGADAARVAQEKAEGTVPIERLLDIRSYEEAIAKVEETFGVSFAPSSLPASVVDGIDRQKRCAVPKGVEVPAEARAVIDHLIEMNTGSAAAAALKSAEWGSYPSLRDRADELTMAQGKATHGIWPRIESIILHYGRKQGLSDRQIREMIERAAKRRP